MRVLGEYILADGLHFLLVAVPFVGDNSRKDNHRGNHHETVAKLRAGLNGVSASKCESTIAFCFSCAARFCA